MSLFRHHSDAMTLLLIATCYIELRVAGVEAKGVGMLGAMLALGRATQAALHFVARKLQP